MDRTQANYKTPANFLVPSWRRTRPAGSSPPRQSPALSDRRLHYRSRLRSVVRLAPRSMAPARVVVNVFCRTRRRLLHPLRRPLPDPVLHRLGDLPRKAVPAQRRGPTCFCRRQPAFLLRRRPDVVALRAPYRRHPPLDRRTQRANSEFSILIFKF